VLQQLIDSQWHTPKPLCLLPAATLPATFLLTQPKRDSWSQDELRPIATDPPVNSA